MPLSFQRMIDKTFAQAPREGKYVSRPVHVIPVGEQADQQEVLRMLSERSCPLISNRVHIGVAGLFNFELAAYTRPDYIFLVDANRRQSHFWNGIRILLLRHEELKNFKCDLISHRYGNYLFLPQSIPFTHQVAPIPVETVGLGDFAEYSEDATWLNDTNCYRYLRNMALNGRIATRSLDLIDDMKRAHALGAMFREAGFHVDTCYWSNILNFTAPTCMGILHRDDGVFGEAQGIAYKVPGFYKNAKGMSRWNGEEHSNGRLIDFKELPPCEKILRNTSAIGGDESTHLFLDTIAFSGLPLMTEGPPRNLARIKKRRALLMEHAF